MATSPVFMRDVAILLLEMIGAVFLFLLFWYFLLCFAYPQCTRGHTSWTVKFVRFSSLSSIGVRLSDVFYRLYALIRPPWKANKFLRSGSESRKVLNWVICKERDRRVQGRTRRERNEADDPIQSFRSYVPLYTEGIIRSSFGLRFIAPFITPSFWCFPKSGWM